MELRSLHRNRISWNCSALGEQALLLSPETAGNKLEIIHQLSRDLEATSLPGVIDVVPAYETLAVIFDGSVVTFDRIISGIEELPDVSLESPKKNHVILICYELGLDWEDVEPHTGLDKETIISKHSSQEYTVAMMGFIPGFVFLEGLPEELACPRRKSPRTRIPPGSVGIGGRQTGIYSLESPGGWNIIGRTPLSFFDVNQTPPTILNPGDSITFKAISEEEFRDA